MRRIISGSVLLLQISIVLGTGISKQECEHYRKFDGDQDAARKYPYMVRVFIDGSDDYKNGVLISRSFVLTSGLWSSDTVRVEVHFLSVDKNRTKSIAVGQQIRHPSHGVESLCLLKLIQPIDQFDEFIRPICLSNGFIGINFDYTEVSTINGLQTRQIRSVMSSSSGDLYLLITDNDYSHNDHAYDGSVLLTKNDEMVGIKAEFKLTGYSNFLVIQRYVGWIEQYVWPVSTVEPIPSSSGKTIGSISAFAVLFICALI